VARKERINTEDTKVEGTEGAEKRKSAGLKPGH
jgi:hypothetical protein